MDSRNEMVVRAVMGICEYANTEVEKMEGEPISDAKIAYLLPFLRGAGYASTIALDAGLKGDVDGHVASFVDGVNHTAFLFDVHDMEYGED